MVPAEPLGAALVALIGVTVFVIRWAVTRTDKDADADDARLAVYDAHTLERITQLERQVADLQTAFSDERHAKHEAMSNAAAYLGTLKVVRWAVSTLPPEQLPGAVASLLDNMGGQELADLMAAAH